MSGHSKWAKLKHTKPLADAKKSKNFSKHSNLIAIAAKQGGHPDPKANPYLRDAIEKARQDNMPQDNIERAIKRGLGLIPGITFEEFVIEAHGPEGIGLIIKIATDNKNRTIPEIKRILNLTGGAISDPGSVIWMFKETGKIEIKKDLWSKNPEIEITVIDAGAEEIFEDEGLVIILTSKESLEKIKHLLIEKGLKEVESEIGYLALNPQKIDSPEIQEKVSDLIKKLEDRDDVNSVYTNVE